MHHSEYFQQLAMRITYIDSYSSINDICSVSLWEYAVVYTLGDYALKSVNSGSLFCFKIDRSK